MDEYVNWVRVRVKNKDLKGPNKTTKPYFNIFDILVASYSFLLKVHKL